MQQNQRTSFKKGQPYLAFNPDLVKNLDGQEGTFEVIGNGNVFTVACEDVPGHSPMLSSLVLNGIKNVWIITRQDPTATEVADESSQRSYAAAGR